MRSAVLFLVFNRPETTEKVFEAIRKAKPPRLYIAADGPRPGRDGEAGRCKEVRKIATNVDWPCEVKTLFRDKNLGCKIGVSSGITWFFEHEEEGIILEDDVLPVETFFPYCDELLERYRDDHRIGVISGCNLISKHYQPKGSYFFSRYNHVWGWATWRDRWKNYDVNMDDCRKWLADGGLKKMENSNLFFRFYWETIFQRTYKGEINSWDYQWTYTCWKNNWLAVLPAENQTANLGFDHDATHTQSKPPKYVVDSQSKSLKLPLAHRVLNKPAAEVEKKIDKKVFGINFYVLFRLFLKYCYQTLFKSCRKK